MGRTMNKKILIMLLSLSMLQAPSAHAGIDAFKLQMAAVGLALMNIFKSGGPGRAPTEQTEGTFSYPESAISNSYLADDPNEYYTGARVQPGPLRAECIPRTVEHRCSYLESDEVVANFCVNPVPVRTGTSNSSGGRSSN